MTDEIEKLLQKGQKYFKALPVVRTPACPTDMDLFMLCFEQEDGPLKNKHLGHVTLCPYCSRYVLNVIRDKIKSRNSLQEMKKKFYPLPEEIDWIGIRTIELFKDNESVTLQNYVHAISDFDFYISEAGFYYLAINTGQIIWRREISSNEIVLSGREQDKTEHYGLASTAEGVKEGIAGFKESFWDGGLQVVLLKGSSRGKLIFRFHY